MIRRQPKFTLFPYTTLFRSRDLSYFSRRADHATFARLAQVETHARGTEAAGAVVGDRKSTRLNSSHANISYAVFCSKKKYEKNHRLLSEKCTVQNIVCKLLS